MLFVYLFVIFREAESKSEKRRQMVSSKHSVHGDHVVRLLVRLLTFLETIFFVVATIFRIFLYISDAPDLFEVRKRSTFDEY